MTKRSADRMAIIIIIDTLCMVWYCESFTYIGRTGAFCFVAFLCMNSKIGSKHDRVGK